MLLDKIRELPTADNPFSMALTELAEDNAAETANPIITILFRIIPPICSILFP
jgi:hypothetical protein